MSRASPAKAAPRRVNAATLAGLGVDRLAELLAGAAKTDAVLKRALTLEVAAGPERLAEEVDRQISRMRTSKGRLTAVRATKLAREIGHLAEVAGERLGGMDAVSGALRLIDILSLGPPLLQRRTGDGGPLLETLLSIPGRMAALVADLGEADQERVADPMYRAFLADPEGVAARLPAAVVAVLKSDARRSLREAVEADIAASGGGRETLHFTAVLGLIADAEGDVDAYVSAQQRRAAPLRDHVGAARRLLDAGRVSEAGSTLDVAPAGAASSALAFVELRIEVLERSSAREQAQSERWRLFQKTLSADVLRRHLSRLPDFEDVEREEDALDYVQAHGDATAALGFLISWPSLRRAAALVRARGVRLDGSAVETLRSAADALALKDSFAATLVLRATIETALQDGARRELARAGLGLAECAVLAARISDWEGRLDHTAYVARLRSRFARKSAFWKAFTAAG